MPGSGVALDIGREITMLRQMSPFLGDALQKIADAANRLAQNTNTSAVGADLPPPPPVDAVNVAGDYDADANTLTVGSGAHPSEIIHAVHTHNSPLQRGIQYVTEVDTDPNFPNPHPLPANTSRSVFATLPTMDSAGTMQGYYLRVTPQYPGSAPQTPTVYGGLQGPTRILLSGTSRMNLLPSQSAGTARPGQGGQGLGPVQARAAVTATKRTFSNQK